MALTLLDILTGPAYHPTPPSFHLCDKAYGTDLNPEDCVSALQALLDRFPSQATHTTLFSWPNNDLLPVRETRGGCQISMEVAGPSNPPGVGVVFTKQDIYNMGAWLIPECPWRRNLGGFVITQDLETLMTYILNPTTIINDPFPNTIYFITLSVTSPGKELAPGDFDPAVPIAIADMLGTLSIMGPSYSGLSNTDLKERESFLRQQAEYMDRGGTQPWWDHHENTAKDTTTYECDTKLGSPSEVDCTQIEWSQLPASDSLSLATDQVKFFQQNSCILAISAAQSITMTWNQIRTAISTLMSVCIQSPFGNPQGGRATYGTPSSTSGWKRKRDATVTGWNALVPGLNISVFNQVEPWVDDTTELTTCTWKAVMHGLDSTKCPT